MLRTQRLIVAILVGISGLWAAGPAQAWGHLKEFGIEQFSGSLMFDLLNEGSIGICVLAADPRYDQENLSALVEASLLIWLEEVRDFVGDDVEIVEDCAPATADLQIIFKSFDGVRSPDGAADIAFRGRRQRGANFFSVIGFNTVGTNAARGRPLVFMSPLDFLSEDLTRAEKIEYLLAISKAAPVQAIGREFDLMAPLFEEAADRLDVDLETVEAVALARDIDDNPIDIFPVMIHELGHGFGLCDMRTAPFAVSCDQRFRTRIVPTSVMAFGGYNLRPDDRDGIRALFERLIRRPFLDQRIFGNDDRQPTDFFNESLVAIERPGEGPAIAYFVGNCRTIATAAQVLYPNGEQVADPARAFLARSIAGLGPVEVDWAASDYATLDAEAALTLRAPESDFIVLPLRLPVAGCQPFEADARMAAAVIEQTGSFQVLSLGGYSGQGLIKDPVVREQTSASCTIHRRDFGNKFYQDPLSFLTDCDLTRGNAGSPVIHLAGGKRYLLGMAVGADRLVQPLRRSMAYWVPDSLNFATFDRGPTFEGQEGNISGANIFVRLNGDFAAALSAELAGTPRPARSDGLRSETGPRTSEQVETILPPQ